MKPRRRRILPSIAGLAFGLGVGIPAFAGLGGDAAGVAADATAAHASLQSTPLQSYDLLEFTTGTGVHVREYLTRDGQVFAVAWDGPVMPDLRPLLGAHFAAYELALAAPHGGMRKSLGIDTPQLVLQAGGHLRAYQGRAYLPALVPAGIAPARLR